MLKIGLTGGIGSGKSTVASVFSHLGIKVYNADDKARYLMVNNPDLRTGIKKLFGDSAYVGMNLNRKYISGKVFNNSSMLESLNQLVHPAVRNDFIHWCEQYNEEVYLMEEAALLFETGFYKDFDFTILVSSPMETRIKRVMERDGTSREEVISRINNQFPEEDKIKLCDFQLKNGENDLLLPQVLNLHNKFVSLHKF